MPLQVLTNLHPALPRSVLFVHLLCFFVAQFENSLPFDKVRRTLQ